MFTQTGVTRTFLATEIRTINQAIIDILPLALATVPWGILCGSLAISIGLTPIQAQLMSLFVFAGAAQLAAVTLIGAGSSLASIFSSTFVISSRHLLYSAVFCEHVKKRSLPIRSCIAFFLTDEMFAVTIAYIEKHKVFNALYAIASGVVFYLIWNASTFIGIIAGKYLPNLEHLGLEFAIAATFIAIVMPSIKDTSTLIAVVTSGLSVLSISFYAPEYALMIATMLGMAAGYCTPIKGKDNG